jgi:prepilin-type N-terminal cleavage/methylation domain-containing protein
VTHAAVSTRARLRAGDAGFSLLELVVAVAVIAILAGVLVPVVGREVEQSKLARSSQDLKTVGEAFNVYYEDTLTWPGNSGAPPALLLEPLAGYACLYSNALAKNGWDGPYLSNFATDGAGTPAIATAGGNSGIVDPWGRNYQVFVFPSGYSGSKGAIVLAGMGSNGVLDTNASQAFAGAPAGDDVLSVATRRL